VNLHGEGYTKQTLVLKYVIPRQPCTTSHSKYVLVTFLVTPKGVVVYGKLRSGITSHKSISEPKFLAETSRNSTERYLRTF